MNDPTPVKLKWTEAGWEYFRIRGTEDFEHVAGMDIEDDQWHQLDIYYSPSARQYFWADQCGNEDEPMWEYIDSAEDIQRGTYSDAAEAILEYDERSAEQGNEAISALQKHRATQRRKATTLL